MHSPKDRISLPRWRHWFALVVGTNTSIGVLLRELRLVGPAVLGREGALIIVVVAVLYTLRTYTHVRTRYVMGRGNDETRPERRKRQALYTLVLLDVLIGLALLAAGMIYLVHPSNWQELIAAATAFLAIALSSDATLRLIAYFGLPRSSEIIERCSAVIWTRELAEHLRDLPGVDKLDSFWDRRTLPHRVSWLIVMLLLLLESVAFGQTVAVATQILL